MSNEKPYIRKIKLTAIVMAIMLLVILIPSSPVYGWLNKDRYQIYGGTYNGQIKVIDTATGEISIKQPPSFDYFLQAPVGNKKEISEEEGPSSDDR